MTEERLLVPYDTYLEAGIHIGTRYKTKFMKNFIYKTRPDGLTVLNVQKIDNRIKLMTNLLCNYEPEDILVVSRREIGALPVRMFGKLTGAKYFDGRYPPGTMTNSKLETYMEVKILVVTDAWPDRNAVKDAIMIGIPIVALCDTNNQVNNIDLVVPCNNKGKNSLGLLFYLLTREFLTKKGQQKKIEKYSVADFTAE